MITRVAIAVALLLAAVPAQAAITFFGVASTPADNGSNGDEPIAITPPASMTSGDLVYVYLSTAAGGVTYTISNDGDGCTGDAWTSLTGHTASNPVADAFWCTFDGAWGADPSFEPSGTGAISTAVMLVFRPTSGSHTFAIDVALTFETEGAATTLTMTGQTRTGSSCVSIASWGTDNATASTWGTLSGTGWSKTSLSAQYRNTGGTPDVSLSFAYNIGTGASNDVAQTQSNSEAGHVSMVSFCETAPPSAGNVRLMLLGIG